MNLSWEYGDPPPHKDKVRLLNEALDLGYNHLDTANIYGMGANKELLADAVMHRRSEFLLASETGIIVDISTPCAPPSTPRVFDNYSRRLNLVPVRQRLGYLGGLECSAKFCS